MKKITKYNLASIMLITITNVYAADTFKTELTIAKPNTQLTIGDASGVSTYGPSRNIKLVGEVAATEVAISDTYNITFENIQNTSFTPTGKTLVQGLKLSGDMGSQTNITGAVITSMQWSLDEAGNTPVPFTSATGVCSLNAESNEVVFGNTSGSCTIKMTGKELNRLSQGYANYNTVTQDNVYGNFSQTITYSVSHS